jgi:hypothetical protein
MRKFIISDIHGFGKLYYSIMNYLDKLSEDEKIELYINGDLFDRGNESVEILLDVIRRIKENDSKFKIKYLGGNHERMMYKVFNKRERGKRVLPFDNWFLLPNGGKKTDDNLNKLLNKDEINEVYHFISNLKIYHKFPEKINNKNIVLVHAACPRNVNDECNMYIKDRLVGYYVWAREDSLGNLINLPIGNKAYFTIVGHTPVNLAFGYEYHKEGNYLNIDGGSGVYATGDTSFNHFPLVEVCNGYLKILTFNSDNEIIFGNYFDGIGSTPFTTEELEREKLLLK